MNTDDMETVGIEPTLCSRHLDPAGLEAAAKAVSITPRGPDYRTAERIVRAYLAATVPPTAENQERDRFLTSPATPGFLAAVEEMRAVFAAAPGTEATRLRMALAAVYPDIFAAGRAAATPDPVIESNDQTIMAAAATPDPPSDRNVARMFHEAYERLAPEFGYHTREESAVPWERVPARNRDLMTATVGEVRAHLAAASPDERLREWPDEGWSPGIDDPEPPALGDIDTGEGWYQT